MDHTSTVTRRDMVLCYGVDVYVRRRTLKMEIGAVCLECLPAVLITTSS